MTRTTPALLLLALLPIPAHANPPLALHPRNPHYFLFRGKPTVLITSTEHYGAVLNRDFNYVPYLDELAARGFNLTRTFSGVYREIPSSFGIIENTLAPKPGRFLCPWVRAKDGKFDLMAYDPAYFARLKDFLTQAGRRGIVVELVLFCTVYNDQLWAVNPMNAVNNVQGIGRNGRLAIYTTKEPALLAAQDALVRKIAAELRDFDNVYFELCNEPYFGGVTKEWTDHVANVVADAEKNFPGRHLIAQNIANGSAKVRDPNPHVSILNFHYATPPTTVAENFALKRAIADDETGFRGKGDLPYRTEAWEFLLAGGAVYDNLDYSFTASKPNGTFVVTTSPGGGGPALRSQLAILKRFIAGFDFVAMRPDNNVIKGGKATGPLRGNPPAARVTVRALAERGKAYAIYVRGGTQAELVLDLPAGSFRAEWVNTITGKVDRVGRFTHQGGTKVLVSPPYTEDIALRVRRTTGAK